MDSKRTPAAFGILGTVVALLAQPNLSATLTRGLLAFEGAAISLVLALAAEPVQAFKGPPPDPVVDCQVRMGATRDPRDVIPRQYGLELRRAGAPRPRVVSRLLTRWIALEVAAGGNSPAAFLAYEACQRRLTRCESLLAPVDSYRPTSELHRRWSEGIRTSLQREARLDAMPLEEKRAHDAADLEDPDGIRRALADGFPDLVAERARLGGWSESMRISSLPWVLVADALTRPEPVPVLARIVRDASVHEVRMLLDPPPKETWEERITIAAYVALDALRRLGDPRAIDRLKQSVALYEPSRLRVLRKMTTQTKPMASPMASRTQYLGILGRKIVETIGDLGDRSYERATLGCSLWDRVEETETLLRLKPTDRVTE